MKLLTGERQPVQIRTYVPDEHGTETYQEREHLVSSVRLMEDGQDVRLKIFSRGQVTPLGELRVLARDGEAVLATLFRRRVTPPADRELFQQLMDDLEDAIVVGDAERRTLVRRRLLAALDTMAQDLNAFCQ